MAAAALQASNLSRTRICWRLSTLVMSWLSAWMVLGPARTSTASSIEAIGGMAAAQQAKDPMAISSDFEREDKNGHRDDCIVLKGETTYQQHVAPTDIMGLFSAIYARVNDNLDDVVRVEINYVGDVIHRLVGTYDVRATVTRLVGEDEGEEGETKENCMAVRVVIEDSNECTLPEDDPMRHTCDPSAVCLNTVGSYECVCPGGEACVPKSGTGLCHDVYSSADCCTMDVVKKPDGCRDETCARDCRRDFRCYTDQCDGKCVYPEMCTSKRGLVTCRCKEGEVGNGHVCLSAMPQIYADADGNVVSTDVDVSKACGCQVPTVDICHGVNCGHHAFCRVVDGVADCACKEGFRNVSGHGCMDDSAPSLKLKGPAAMTMKQCQKYIEKGVEVVDANSENDDRQVGVTYSQPPGRCTPEMGSFTVNYTLNTEWTHPAVQYIVRHVTVEDIDECSLDPASPEAQCPGCRAACHEHAICENMVGTYTCKCPSCMSGDGFDPFIPKKSTRVPPGYEGGSGCRDSCRPVITLLGDNPLVLDVVVTTDLQGRPLKTRNYTDELSGLIANTRGGGLCPEGGMCAIVLDNNGTHEDVDITHKLTISTLSELSKSPPQWRVTYNAVDLAGNFAEPVTRLVEIRERAECKIVTEQCECPECPKCRSCAEEGKLLEQVRRQQEEEERLHRGMEQAPRCPPCDCTVTKEQRCRNCDCNERSGCLHVTECPSYSAHSVQESISSVTGMGSFSQIGSTPMDQVVIAVLVVLVMILMFMLCRS